MQQVLPQEGSDFMSVYLNDVLIFSEKVDEHLEHLELVISHVKGAGMKFKPKCQFVRQEVEYLGHIITPEELKANPKLSTSSDPPRMFMV